jgi:hypothetical protein
VRATLTAPYAGVFVASCLAGPVVSLESLGGAMDLEHVDLTPITDLFADVTGAHGVAGGKDGA